MPTIQLCLFGAPGLFYNTQPLELARRKALALVAYLAVPERRHSRDRLATLLWPD